MANQPEDPQYSSGDSEKAFQLDGMTADEILETIVAFDDPNIDRQHILEGVLEDDSPYPEVRSAVANTDDPSIPVSTLRVYVMGVVWAVLIAGLNQFFFFRYPSVTISSFVAQLLAFPLGRAWAKMLPNWRIFGMQLNPGPFSIKEHVLVTIMASVGASCTCSKQLHLGRTVDLWYLQLPMPSVISSKISRLGLLSFLSENRRTSLPSRGFTTVRCITSAVSSRRRIRPVCSPMSWMAFYQWMLVMSTQLIGFSIGGILRRFLVNPPSMIWPANLVTCALFNTLHAQTYAGMGNHGGISRERFFFYAWSAAVIWYFFPGYIFTALSYFSWVCWVAPNNVVVNQMFGYISGLGMSLITFDWSQIAYIGSPLATPWWAEANVAIGFVFFFWLVVPCIYYTNTWYSKYLPMSTRTSYDNTGASYNISRIINADASFNITAYEGYSPLFLSTTFALSYGLSFASITSTLMHAFLFFRKQIWVQSRRSMHEQADIHARLMSKYKQVPEWWYMIIFVSMFIIGVVSIELWHTEFPVWAFVLSLLIAFFYVIPIGMIQAITNQQVGLNVITELIVGYALPGRPIAMMMFKTWGYITMAQALTFASDFKLGHYMKIPPRTMFWAQVAATVIAGTVQLGVQAWMFTNIPDMCSPEQKNGFICPSTEVFGTASFIWGVIGPQRMFSKGQVYYGKSTFFFRWSPGVLTHPGLSQRSRTSSSSVHFVPSLHGSYLSSGLTAGFAMSSNFPVVFNGTGLIPPASAVNYVPWTIVGFIFNYVIRRRHFSWWTKYNYVLSAAMDSGVAVSIILIFFILQYPADGTIGLNTIQKWWGNTVYLNTADAQALPLLPIPDSGMFG
ncbi:hypothetical protein ID866_2885 [Astraeus odoratus]|nr:hypothetical protein ID866_2885 [Astraeus odoratus]